jgi:putative transcriptional regulator
MNKPIDVRSIRIRIGRTQARFASLIGVSIAAVQGWEQNRRKPSRLARRMLAILNQNPSAIIAELERARSAYKTG